MTRALSLKRNTVIKLLRRLGWSLLALALTAVTLLGLLAVALSTEPGTRQSLALLQRALPGITVDGVQGDWIDGLGVERFRYAEPGVEVALTDIRLNLSGRALLIGQLRLTELAAATLLVRVQDDGSDDGDDSLTRVATPLPLVAKRVTIGQLTIDTGGSPLQLSAVSGAVSWLGTRLHFSEAGATLEQWRAQATGQIRLANDYALTLDGRVDGDDTLGAITVRTWGDLRRLGVELRSDGDWPLTVTGSLWLLDDGLPLQFVAEQNRPLQWGEGDASIGVDKTVLTARGTLDAIAGELKATVTQAQFGAMPLQATVAWRGDQLSFTPALTVGDGALRGDCALTLAQPFPLRCDGELQQLALAPLGVDASVSTPFQLDLSEPATPALQLLLPAIDGTLLGRPLRGNLSVATADGSLWQVRQLELQSGDNRLQASGHLHTGAPGSRQSGADSQLQLQLEARALAQLEPSLAGALIVNAQLAGTLASPSLTATVDGSDLGWGEQQVGRLRAEVTIADGGRRPSRLQLSAGDLQLADGLPPLQLTLRANGTAAAHQWRLDAASSDTTLQLQCDGRADIDKRDASLRCEDLRGQLPLGNQLLAWRADQPLLLSWRAQPQRLRLAPFCLRADSGSLCLKQALAIDGSKVAPFQLAGREVPLRWSQPWLPKALRPDADSTASLDVAFISNQPLQLTAALELPASEWRLRTSNGRRTLPLQTTRAELQLDAKRAALTASGGIVDLGALDLQLDIADPRGARTLSGVVNLRGVALSTLGNSIDSVVVSAGLLDGRLDLGGSLASPSLGGHLSVRDGELQVELLADRITELTLDAWFEHQGATLQGRFRNGNGFGTLQGSAQWPTAEEWALRLTLEGSAVRLAPLPDSEATVDTRMVLALAPRAATLSGNVQIRQAEILIKELPPETISPSPDTVVIGRQQESTLLDRLAIDLGVELGQQFHFAGFGADTHLTGDLHLVRQPNQALRAEGEVSLVDGRYRAYGQRLLVQRGQFIFTGPLDNPTLDLKAIRELAPVVGYDEVEVGLQVTGMLKDPQARIFSTPSMPESNAAYYLLTGRPPPEGTTGTEFSAGGTLLSLGLLGGQEQAEKLAERFGISDLQISTSDGDSGSQAEVSGYVADRLYVRYGAGLDDQGNTITFQYQLTKRLVIEALSGLNDALDLIYTFTID